MRVLVVEDQADIRDLVQESLELGGFWVKSTMNGSTGLELALGETWHAIVLDALLPGVDGWEICRQLRASKVHCPVLMLTARDAVEDRVRGLELGADDYLTKPFDVKELVARVHALTRRGQLCKGRFIKIGDLEIDTLSQRVSRSAKPIQLTKREYTLLTGLAVREGQVLTREVIQERIWMDEYAVSNTVEAYIKLLRKKIDAGFDEKLIHTVHGFGYCLERRQSP